MRLAKYLAQAGVASRRAAERIVSAGRVKVNGLIELKPQVSVTIEDIVTLDGERVKLSGFNEYLLLNKPQGYLSTVQDTHDRPTVLDLVKGARSRLFPVGRLDADTSGVLLLTNDGKLAYRLTHPRYGIKKIYLAGVKGIPGVKALDKLIEGVEVDGVLCVPDAVSIVRVEQQEMRARLQITLTEGRKRQVKRMLAAVNHPVFELERISFAGLTAASLARGAYRLLTEKEVEQLYRMVKL